MKKLVSILCILCTLTMIFSLAACGDKTPSSSDPVVTETAEQSDPIIGSWKYEGGDYTYTFKEDKTGTYTYGSTTMNFTYETSEGKLTLNYEGNTMPTVLEYEINGNTLNVKDSFGKDTIYNRV